MSELQHPSRAMLTNSPGLSNDSAFLPSWLKTIVFIGAILMAAGALIAILNPAMLVSPHDEINAAVHIYAGYLFARNGTLAVFLIAATIFRSRATLNILLLLSGSIQLLDAGVDCAEGRWIVAPGVLVLGILFFLAAARLSGHPLWRKQAWTAL